MDIYDTIKHFLIICLVFIPLERILPLKPNQAILRQGWSNDLKHVFLTRLMVYGGALLLISLSVAYLAELVPLRFRVGIAAQSIWLQYLEILILADIGFYWVHRAFHEVPCLWRLHTIHHSIEELDFLAAHRVHPIDQIITRSATLVPVFILGYDLEAIAVFAFTYRWHSLLLHSNVKIEFGPLQWVFASPRFHHWHHAKHHQARNRNYAAQLSILDTIFGSIYLPKNTMPTLYGIDEAVPGSYLGQMIFPFRKIKSDKASESIESSHTRNFDTDL